MTDQHRFDTLGCYGAPICRTPNLDALAARGVRFSRAYTNTVPCSPARAALYTGRYPHCTGVRQNKQRLDPQLPTLATELGAAGYSLGYAGKWHVDYPRTAPDHGFKGKSFPDYGYPIYRGLIDGIRWGLAADNPDRVPHYENWLDEKGLEYPRALEAHYGDNPGKQTQEIYALQSGDRSQSFETMVAEDAVGLLRSAKRERDDEGKPFFLWANFWGPHTPIFIPEPYYSMYDPEQIPEDPSFHETWENKPYVMQLVERLWGLSEGGWDRWRRIVAKYWGYVTMLDDLVGKILDELRALGLEDETLVVFTTDHGDNMGAHRLIEKGPFTHEETYRLPLIAASPDCTRPGANCDEFVYLQDLFPTFVEQAGGTPPEVPDTSSILPQIVDPTTPTGRDTVYTQFHGHLFPFEQRMVRSRSHKLVYNPTDRGELYDLIRDPHELVNVYGRPEVADVQAQLMLAMRAHMEQVGDPALGGFNAIRAVY